MSPSELAKLSKLRNLTKSGAARSIRLAADCSLADIAEPVGVEPSTIWRWEHGNRRPRGEAALRYADVLHELMAAQT